MILILIHPLLRTWLIINMPEQFLIVLMKNVTVRVIDCDFSFHNLDVSSM